MSALIRPAAEADRQGIADTIVEAFYDQFKSLTTDKEAVAAALAPMLNLPQFTVAEQEGCIVGAVGLNDENAYAVTIKPDVLKKAVGFIRGTMAAPILREEFNRPGRFEPGQAQVDFVSVRKSTRGQGIARAMLQHVLAKDYRLFTLDVTEGNERVLPLYQSVGFVQTGREQEKMAKMKGFSFRYLMAYRPAGRQG
jgi:ribosomal protein S18 acetylase RimI-like enzyme